MKKIILIILFFASIAGYSQTYWQDSLAKYEKKESKKTYGWFDSLTSTKQQKQITDHYSLEVKVRIEQRLNRISDSTTGANQDTMTKQAYILHLQTAHSFGCNKNNLLPDWEKIYNDNPAWFGQKSKAWIDETYANATLNDFLSFARQYGY